MNAKIKCYNNRPTIFIDGKPVPPIIYALTDWIGGRLSYDEITRFSMKRCSHRYKAVSAGYLLSGYVV